MMQVLHFVDSILLMLVAVLNFAGHLFPWHVISCAVDGSGKLYRLVAYAYGTTTIWVAVAGWALARHLTGVPVTPWDGVTFHGLGIVAAGVGAVVPRIVRWVAEAQARAGDVSDYEQAIRS
jgi:hypothetical protein